MEKSCILNFNTKEIEKELPCSWEEFCSMFPILSTEFYITNNSALKNAVSCERHPEFDQNILPNRVTAEAILSLIKLINLRNAYNGDWVPDWSSIEKKYFIKIDSDALITESFYFTPFSPLYFKSEALCNEFLSNFHLLIKRIMPLYGIKEGGE